MESVSSILSMIETPRRRRKVLYACCALGGGGYLAYRIYSFLSLARKRLELYKFFSSLSSLLETAAIGSDCAGVLWKDLHTFVLSNDDDVPQSLKQFFKIGRTREFQESVALLCMSVTKGIASSLSEQGSDCQDGIDYGSALFEELSSRKKLGRKMGTPSREFVHKDSRDRLYSWKDRRWRSLGEIEGSLEKQTVEGDDNYKVLKDGRNESASQIDEAVTGHWLKEEFGRHSPFMSSRNYYGERGSRIGLSIGETSAVNGNGKSKAYSDRRGNAERKAEGIPEKLVGKLFSEAGRGFASAVVASAVRSLVHSFLEGYQELKRHNSNVSGPKNRFFDDLEALAGESSRQNGVQEEGSSDGAFQKRIASHSNFESFQDGIFEFLCSGRGKTLIADCIETFIGTAVSTYLDKTQDEHFYEDVLSTVAKPAHRDNVKELLTSVCNGAVETFIRTSHDVMVAGGAGPHESAGEYRKHEEDNPRDVDRSVYCLAKSSSVSNLPHSEIDDSGDCVRSEGATDQFSSGSQPLGTPVDAVADRPSAGDLSSRRIAFDHSPQSEKKGLNYDLSKIISNMEEIVLPPSIYQPVAGKVLSFPPSTTENSLGWIDGVSRTLAVPSNRALVLDVAGTVSAEAVRSAIEVVASKVSSLNLLGDRKEKGSTLADGQSSSRVLRVISRTGELATLTASKAMIAVTMCLAICLHTLVGPSHVPS